MRNLIKIESENDRAVWQKRIDLTGVSIFSIERLKKFVENRGFENYRCGCDYDCCGCVAFTHTELFRSEDSAIIVFTTAYNY